jgi:large repetitive protein
LRKIFVLFLVLELLIFPSAGYANATDDSYAVISNESTDSSTFDSTGTFHLKNMKFSMNEKLKTGAYAMDVVKPFDALKYKGKLTRKSMRSIEITYNVGDSKDFWVTNFETNSDYQMNARLAYSGTKVNIWVNNSQISDLEAERIGEEFDHKIYPSIVNNFGVPSDIDNNGKVNILTYDIQDGYSGSGSYVAGYFWPGDLYSTPASNQSDIFYIDTYPTMGTDDTKDVTQIYGTLAHELQHMVNYNENVLIEGSANEMDVWLDEGLSMAAEQIYSGQGLSDRVDYYNSSSSIQNGKSLLYWDYYGDTLANYSLSYLFVQYVKKQADHGDRIFKEILADPNNNYQAIENVAKKYISPDMTFGKLMTNFRIALLLKDDNGLYGFKGDSFFDSIKSKIYTGNSASLRGGGAVVTTFLSSEGFVGALNRGPDITYTLLNMVPGKGGMVAPAPLAEPVVNPVSDVDTQITGMAEPNVTVYARANQTEIGRTTANASGAFTMNIPAQRAGMMVEVYAQASFDHVSKAVKIMVKDVTAPAAPKVNVVTNLSKMVTGLVESNAYVRVFIGKSVLVAKADSNGNFRVAIPVQKAGVKIILTAIDAEGNESSGKSITVIDKIAPTAPTVNSVSNKTRVLIGRSEAGAAIIVTIGKAKYMAKADGKGNFKVMIPVQKAGIRIHLVAKDAAGNLSTAKNVAVVDKIAPSLSRVNTVSNLTKVLTGRSEAGATIIVTIGKAKYTAKVDAKGNFKVTIPFRKAGTRIAISAKDPVGNVSAAKIVIVLDKNPPVKPVVSTVVKSKTKEVAGRAEANSTVTIKLGNKVIGKARVNRYGKFKVKIKAQKKNTILVITAIDAAKNVSKSRIIKVK